jgi:hypothetical protein
MADSGLNISRKRLKQVTTPSQQAFACFLSLQLLPLPADSPAYHPFTGTILRETRPLLPSATPRQDCKSALHSGRKIGGTAEPVGLG